MVKKLRPYVTEHGKDQQMSTNSLVICYISSQSPRFNYVNHTAGKYYRTKSTSNVHLCDTGRGESTDKIKFSKYTYIADIHFKSLKKNFFFTSCGHHEENCIQKPSEGGQAHSL